MLSTFSYFYRRSFESIYVKLLLKHYFCFINIVKFIYVNSHYKQSQDIT